MEAVAYALRKLDTLLSLHDVIFQKVVIFGFVLDLQTKFRPSKFVYLFVGWNNEMDKQTDPISPSSLR
jgi:hypothetical protein